MESRTKENRAAGKSNILGVGIVILAGVMISPVRGVSYYDITLPSYPPTGVLYTAAGLSDTNQIVGPPESDPALKAYLWQSGSLSFLPIPYTDMGNYAADINSSGKIVGGQTGGFGPGVLLVGTTVTSLGTLGGEHSTPYAINDSDQVAGCSQTTTVNEIAPFFWESGSMQPMGTLGGTYGRAYALNNNGTAVGFSKNAAGKCRAFVWRSGEGMSDLGTLGGDQSIASAINDANEIVGWSETAGGYQHAFIRKDGVMTDLGTMGGNQSQAFAINNAGLIIGWAETQTGYRPLVIWENGTAVRLDQLVAPDCGWELVYPGESQFDYRPSFAINSNGAILGRGFINNARHVFLMTPRPEPFLLHDSDQDGTVNLSDLSRFSSEWIR